MDALQAPGSPAGAPANDPRAPQAAAPGAEGGGEQATPEEQALAEGFIARAMMAFYNKAFFPDALEALDDEENPKEAIADVAANVFKRVYEAGVEQGQQFPPAVILEAASEFFAEVANTAARFRFIDFDADEGAFDGAYYLFMDKLRVMATEAGLLDMEDVQADFAAMVEQDRAGGAAEPANDNRAPLAPANENAPPAAAPRRGLF